MKFTILALAGLVSTGLATAIPDANLVERSCYKCVYKYDDCGKSYGGSYNYCKHPFDYYYPKPYCPKDPKNKCYKIEYKNDDCGKKYGGGYDSCKDKFDHCFQKPKCKDDDDHDDSDDDDDHDKDDD